MTGNAKTVSCCRARTPLNQAVAAYATYVNQQTAQLVSSKPEPCANAINDWQHGPGQGRYPKARIYYERIEPVASKCGALSIPTSTAGLTTP